MTKLIVNNIDSTIKTDFLDIVSANYDNQWLDKFGIIKSNRPTVDTATIPSGTNGISVGSITVSAGNTVTVNGEWRII